MRRVVELQLCCPVCDTYTVKAQYAGEDICMCCFSWLENLNTTGPLAGQIWEGITRHGPGRIPPCCWSPR